MPIITRSMKSGTAMVTFGKCRCGRNSQQLVDGLCATCRQYGLRLPHDDREEVDREAEEIRRRLRNYGRDADNE
jgi:phage terminase Nu1 subunit (DNA packaging protein)